MSSPSLKAVLMGIALLAGACASLPRAVRELRVCADPNNLPFSNQRLEGFEKTDVLQPGQTQTITMTVAARDLGFWNQPAARRQVDDGTYQFELGYDSDNIADSQTVAVTGGLTSHVKYVTVEPPAVVYKPGDTVDLTAKNPWLKDDTNPASEQRTGRWE